MKWISTTIKKKWLEKILSGEKTVERKVANEFWTKRLEKFVDGTFQDDIGINFLCGCESYKFKVININKCYWRDGFDIDGVITQEWYEIRLGEQLWTCPMGDKVCDWWPGDGWCHKPKNEKCPQEDLA